MKKSVVLVLFLIVSMVCFCQKESGINKVVVIDSTVQSSGIDTSNVCGYIIVETNKFTGDISYISPWYDGIYFFKVKSTNNVNNTLSEKIYIHIQNKVETSAVNKKGVTLLLGTALKISKPNAIISIEPDDSGYGGYQYNTEFELNEDDLKLLLENEITVSKVSAYNAVVEHGLELKDYIKCIIME